MRALHGLWCRSEAFSCTHRFLRGGEDGRSGPAMTGGAAVGNDERAASAHDEKKASGNNYWPGSGKGDKL